MVTLSLALVQPSSIPEHGAVIAGPLHEAVEVLDHDLPQQLRVLDVQNRLPEEEPAGVLLASVLLVQVRQMLVHVGHVGPQQVEGPAWEVALLVGDAQLLELVELLGDVGIEEQGAGAGCDHCCN